MNGREKSVSLKVDSRAGIDRGEACAAHSAAGYLLLVIGYQLSVN